MLMPELIKKKRDGQELSKEEIYSVINGCTTGEIPDYQLSALMMAIYFSGMTKAETVAMTLAMRDSGDKADLSGISGFKADKHSTGGVGDKTTLIVAPIVAACGIKVAKMSGRGLGHTGGTVDKLESIPGFRTNISPRQLTDIVNKCGLSVTGQSGNLCPADKKLYALRDVTATVESIPLIASSIMSKKLADGADCILLDVKTGSGSFMKTEKEARLLAKTMVDIGNEAGTKTSALITNMDAPLGKMIGNSLEVQEAIEVLKGKTDSDLYVVCRALAANMLMLAGCGDEKECGKMADEAVASGTAFERLRMMVAEQGGDVAYVDNPSEFPSAKYSRDIQAPKDGYIFSMDSEAIGTAAVVLGAGRARKEDAVNHAAGIRIEKKTGDYTKAGEVIATLYTDDESSLGDAQRRYLNAVQISSEKPEKIPMILGKIE